MTKRRPAWLIEHGTTIQEARRCRAYNGDRACQACATAKNNLEREGYNRRVRRLAADPTIRQHGTYNTFQNWGCRCDECFAAHTARNTARRGFSTRLTAPRGPKPTIEPFGREWINA